MANKDKKDNLKIGNIFDDSRENIPTVGRSVPDFKNIHTDISVTESDSDEPHTNKHAGFPPAAGQGRSGMGNPYTKIS